MRELRTVSLQEDARRHPGLIGGGIAALAFLILLPLGIVSGNRTQQRIRREETRPPS